MKTLTTLAAVALLTAPAFAQQRRTPTTPGDTPSARTDAGIYADAGTPAMNDDQQGRVDDAALVRWIAQDNHAEIALAQYAIQKSQNTNVRQFAEKMIQDHQKFASQLKQGFDGTDQAKQSETRRQSGTVSTGNRTRPNAAGSRTQPNDVVGNVDRTDAGRSPAGAADPGDAATDIDGTQSGDYARNERTNRGQGRMNRDRPAAGSGENMEVVFVPVEYEFVVIEGFAPEGMSNSTATANNLLEFRQQLGEQCLASLKTNFDKLSPADFDKVYATQQIGAHLKMVDTLKLAESKVSPELKNVLQEGQQVTRQHLQHAITLLNQVTDAN